MRRALPDGDRQFTGEQDVMSIRRRSRHDDAVACRAVVGVVRRDEVDPPSAGLHSRLDCTEPWPS